MKWCHGVLIGLLCLEVGCVSLSGDARISVCDEAFYEGTDDESSVLWESVLNDALAERAFILYSAHTKNEYAKMTERQGCTLRFSIHRDGESFIVDDFPVPGSKSHFAVDKAVENGRICVTDLLKESDINAVAGNAQNEVFEVVVTIDANLVKRYFERQFDPLVVYPFLGKALDNLSPMLTGSYLVAPALKTDRKLFVYGIEDGNVWEVLLPCRTDTENLRFFVEHVVMHARSVDGMPTAKFWESENLADEDVQFWHSYLVKLLARFVMRKSGCQKCDSYVDSLAK